LTFRMVVSSIKAR